MTTDPYFIYNEHSTSNIVITVEHAGREWPEGEDIFGMPDDW